MLAFKEEMVSLLHNNNSVIYIIFCYYAHIKSWQFGFIDILLNKMQFTCFCCKYYCKSQNRWTAELRLG